MADAAENPADLALYREIKQYADSILWKSQQDRSFPLGESAIVQELLRDTPPAQRSYLLPAGRIPTPLRSLFEHACLVRALIVNPLLEAPD